MPDTLTGHRLTVFTGMGGVREEVPWVEGDGEFARERLEFLVAEYPECRVTYVYNSDKGVKSVEKGKWDFTDEGFIEGRTTRDFDPEAARIEVRLPSFA